MTVPLNDRSEFRHNPLLDRQVLFCETRVQRPGDFNPPQKKEKKQGFCPFCPGHEEVTPDSILEFPGEEGGWMLRDFPNKFNALHIEGGLEQEFFGPYKKMNGIGAHEVLVECRDHKSELWDLELGPNYLTKVLLAYQQRINDLKGDPRFKNIQIFKNRGESAGASLDHAHSQLIALPIVSLEYKIQILTFSSFFDERRRSLKEGETFEALPWGEKCLLCNLVENEYVKGQCARIVIDNDKFVAFVPYASQYPFEVWITPKQHAERFEDSSYTDLEDLGTVLFKSLRSLKITLDDPDYNLFLVNRPVKADDVELLCFHYYLRIIPRIIKGAGFELAQGITINTVLPEHSASYLCETLKEVEKEMGVGQVAR